MFNSLGYSGVCEVEVRKRINADVIIIKIEKYGVGFVDVTKHINRN